MCARTWNAVDLAFAWHSQALAGTGRHWQAPCRIEQQLNRARLQLCFRAFPYTPEPVDCQPPSQDGPALISHDSICWRPHSPLASCSAKTTTTRLRHASTPALHRSPCCCRRYLLYVFRLLALRVNPPHLGGEELAANARICDRLHHSNRPAPDRVPGFA